MGVWKGLYLAQKDLEEMEERKRKLDLKEAQEERLRKAAESNDQLKRLKTLMTIDLFPSGSSRKTNVSIKGDLVKDLQKYLPEDSIALTKAIASNNPEIQNSLLTALRKTHNQAVEGGASATNINKVRLAELYEGINIMPGQDQNLMLENIMTRSVQLGISPETWVQYPEIYAKLQRQIKQASLPTANIATMSITPSLSGTEIQKSMDLILRNHREDLDIIQSNLDAINIAENLPTNFTQWVTKYASFVNNIKKDATEAKKLAFTGMVDPDNLYDMFEGRADIYENPYINEIIKKAEQLKKSDVMEIDLVGDKEPGAGTSYIYRGDPAKEAVYQKENGKWYWCENNPYALTRKYFNLKGVKLIPEGSLIKIMMRKRAYGDAPGAPKYRYDTQKAFMEY